MVVLVGLTAAAVLGGIPTGWSDAASSHRHEALPEETLHPEDLQELRFDVGLRGYRMDQVDAVLERLGEELQDRDRQLAELRPARVSVVPSDEVGDARRATVDRSGSDATDEPDVMDDSDGAEAASGRDPGAGED